MIQLQPLFFMILDNNHHMTDQGIPTHVFQHKISLESKLTFKIHLEQL